MDGSVTRRLLPPSSYESLTRLYDTCVRRLGVRPGEGSAPAAVTRCHAHVVVGQLLLLLLPPDLPPPVTQELVLPLELVLALRLRLVVTGDGDVVVAVA